GGREERMERVAVVFPAYNEERHVGEAADAALGAGAGLVVCVDDCSEDRTGAIVQQLAEERDRVLAVHHLVNQGKQAAVKHGLQRALGRPGWEAVAVLDADMQDDPALLPGMCHLAGPYDVVIGRRGRGQMPPVRRLANRLANAPYRLLARIPITDVQSGYRIYTRQVAQFLAENLAEEGGYTLEHTSMLLFGRLAAQRGRLFRIAEVDIPYSYGAAESSITVRDNLQLTWAALYHAIALARLRKRGTADDPA
ncbi:MAG: glycosyltransferase family 2 protein, partial [Candidatus Brocadiaceae bacterium]